MPPTVRSVIGVVERTYGFNEKGYEGDIDALADTFGFECPTLEEYLRHHGWGKRRGWPRRTAGWVKAL